MTTAARRPLSFGLKTSQMGLGYDDILELWREADQVPAFEHAWLWDHMLPLRGDVRAATLEAWTLLAALAAQTSRLRLGVIVTSNRLRPPTLLAKMAATVDHISRGRLVLGIGAGGSRVADAAGFELVEREFAAYGLEVVSPADAVGALDEACQVIRQMWTAREPFDFEGRHYRLRGTVCEPGPVQRPHPPIMIGAGGERLALRVVARHADVWNCPARTAEEFRHKSLVLDEHCRAIGRDPETIVRSVQVIVASDDPEDARRRLIEFVEAGCSHLVVAPRPPWPPRTAAWIAEEIIEPVLARAAALA
jgi:alkanesulfonate monooxygenase SsuD/methylene tetrahydromethanopterin reductase-like flavin-dependent oxidoreductase (luciferase family)